MSKIMLNTLSNLLSIESYSGEEEEVAKYVIKKLKKYGFRTKQDSIGNVYAVRGESGPYPLLNAHMDSVRGRASSWNYSYTSSYKQSSPVYQEIEVGKSKKLFINTDRSFRKDKTFNCCMDCRDFKDCYEKYGYAELYLSGANNGLEARAILEELYCTMFVDKNEAKTEKEEEKEKGFTLTYNPKTFELKSNGTRPMGGDDKCGIALALETARTTDIPMKILFTVQEEIGLVGINHAVKNHEDWFADCSYCITIDRKGGNHICLTTGSKRNANNYFFGELTKWAFVSGIKPSFEAGTSSDNAVIRNYVTNAINISAGYYSPHTNGEYVKFDEMELIAKWVKNFVTKADIDQNQLVERNAEEAVCRRELERKRNSITAVSKQKNGNEIIVHKQADNKDDKLKSGRLLT